MPRKSPVIALLREGRLEDAIDCFLTKNVADKYSASSLVAHLGKSGSQSMDRNYKTAAELADICLYVYGECVKNTTPHAVLLASLLDASRKIGFTDRALDVVWKDFASFNPTPTSQFFSSLLLVVLKEPDNKYVVIVYFDRDLSYLRYATHIANAILHIIKNPNKVDPYQPIVYGLLVQVFAEQNDIIAVHKLFDLMTAAGKRDLFNSCAYANFFNACSKMNDLKLGEQVRAHMESKREVTALWDPQDHSRTNVAMLGMYYSCAGFQKASEVFATMIPTNDNVLYTVMIQMYIKNGDLEGAIGLFENMRAAGIHPDSVTYVVLLSACADTNATNLGKFLHQQLSKDNIPITSNLANALINMYGTFGDFNYARDIFAGISKKTDTWNSLISACASTTSPRSDEAMELFQQMTKSGVLPNAITFSSLLKIFAQGKNIKYGAKIYEYLHKYSEHLESPNVFSALINFDGKCNGFESAKALYLELARKRTAATPTTIYNTLIGICADEHRLGDALQTWKQMKLEGGVPNRITYISLLTVFTNTRAKEQGEAIYKDLLQSPQFYDDPVVLGALMTMYSKCGDFKKAITIFSEYKSQGKHIDVSFWNVMLAIFLHHDLITEAMQAFDEMNRMQVNPNQATFSTLFTLCANVKALAQGIKIHEALNNSTDSRIAACPIVISALMNLYGRCDHPEKSVSIFSEFLQKGKPDPHVWSVLFKALENNPVQDAKLFFEYMKKSDSRIDSSVFVPLFTLCANTGSLDFGKEALEYLSTTNESGNIRTNTVLASALINMYGKCNALDEAQRIFDDFSGPVHTLAPVLVHAYAPTQPDRALEIFHKYSSVSPTAQLFTNALIACSYGGLVDEAKAIYGHIEPVLARKPNKSQFAVLVTALAAAGRISEALDLVKGLEDQTGSTRQHFALPDVSEIPAHTVKELWTRILQSCRAHRHLENVEEIAKKLLELVDSSKDVYGIVISIYTENNEPEKAREWEQKRLSLRNVRE